MISSFECDTD